MLNTVKNSNPPTIRFDDVGQYYDDPNAEYLNADGTAKSTTYMLIVMHQVEKNLYGVLPTLTYYAKDDFDAYVRSNEMIRKHMLSGDMDADNKFIKAAKGAILKPHRVDPVDGQTIFREVSKADMPCLKHFSKVGVGAA